MKTIPLLQPSLGAIYYIKYRYGQSIEETKKSIQKALEAAYKEKTQN